MQEPLVQIKNLTLSYHSKVVLRDVEWTINFSENWLLGGESGSGKTSLAKIIAAQQHEQITLNNILRQSKANEVYYVENWYQFKNKEGVANFYYQQRYTSLQTQDIHTVKSELQSFGSEHNLDFSSLTHLLKVFGVETLLEATLIELSSGEHKKLQLVKAFWLNPCLLILDEPYTGLDATTRKNLNILIDHESQKGSQYILITNEKEIPSSINRFAFIEDGKLNLGDQNTLISPPNRRLIKLPPSLSQSPNYTSDQIIKMIDVKVGYGDKEVLKNINWEVNAGEKWLIQGHNGSGKSTLLSLINGDHPQAYANSISLFGNERGSGESIWDIKKQIGLISPELHWYFDANATVWQSIASGITDSIGMFTTLPESKKNLVTALLTFFELDNYSNELLTHLPLGKQRLVLLARTIIKNPPLLILDEPCQGLDAQQTFYFNQLVDEIAQNGTTLIYVAHNEDQLPKCLTHRLMLSKGEIISSTKNYQIQEDLA